MTCGLLPQIRSSGFAIALVDLLELRIDNAGLALRAAIAWGRAGTGSRAAHGLREAHRRLRQLFGHLSDALDVFAVHRVPEGGYGLLDAALHIRRNAPLGLLEALLYAIDRRIR